MYFHSEKVIGSFNFQGFHTQFVYNLILSSYGLYTHTAYDRLQVLEISFMIIYLYVVVSAIIFLYFSIHNK